MGIEDRVYCFAGPARGLAATYSSGSDNEDPPTKLKTATATA